MLFPVLYYVLTGERVMIFPLYIPFLDDSTWQGFLTYYALHSWWCVQLIIGLVGADLLMALLLLHTLPIVEIFELSITELNYELVSFPAARQSLMVKMQLRNVIQMHKEIFMYEHKIYLFVINYDVSSTTKKLLARFIENIPGCVIH